MVHAQPLSKPRLGLLQLSVAECIERVLFEHGIQIAATVPGGPLMPLLRTLHGKGRIRSVLTRHECGAAMLAEGYWRVARKPAVVAVTAGPGVSNAVTGIALAMAEQTPLIVISAQVATSWYGRGAAQELDTLRLLEPLTKASASLVDPTRTQAILEHLIMVATTGRGGPVHLSVPANLWTQLCPFHPAREPAATKRARRWGRTSPHASLHEVALLRERLETARAPSLLAGRGVVLAGAERHLLALAERYPKLRVACTPRSKGAFPERHPQSLGVFGFAGHEAAEQALLEQSDQLLILGSRLGEITSLGWDERFRNVPLVQVDIEPAELGKNFPIELGIVGDLAPVLEELVGAVPSEPTWRPRPNIVAAPVVDPALGGRVAPSSVMHALDQVLSGDEHVFVDIGNCMAWATHLLQRDQPGRWHVNLMYGCMGHALPAAIGGALADPRPVVVVVGDAAFAMSGFELHTAVENDLPVIVVVLNDSGHGMVEMGSEWQFGPNAVPSARFRHGIDARCMARSVGARANRVRTEHDFRVELRAALTRRAPSLIDVSIDPSEVPPFGSRMDLLKKNFAATSGGGRD